MNHPESGLFPPSPSFKHWVSLRIVWKKTQHLSKRANLVNFVSGSASSVELELRDFKALGTLAFLAMTVNLPVKA